MGRLGVADPSHRIGRPQVLRHLPRLLERAQLIVEVQPREPSGHGHEPVTGHLAPSPGQAALGGHGPRPGRNDHGVGHHLDPRLEKTGVGLVDLAGEDPELAGLARRGHQRHGVPALTQRQRQHRTHVVVVIVVDDQVSGLDRLLVQHCLGADDGRPGRDRFQPGARMPPDGVSRPDRTGGDDHLRGRQLDHIGRGQAAFGKDLDALELVDLADAPVAHPRPFGEPRQARFPADPATQLALGLGQHDPISALAQHPGGFQPRRPSADDQHPRRLTAARRADPVRARTARHQGRHALRVPAQPPLLAHGRVLGAADRHPE